MKDYNVIMEMDGVKKRMRHKSDKQKEAVRQGVRRYVKNSEVYDFVFEKILENKNEKEKDYYQYIENLIEIESMRMQKALGIYAYGEVSA